MTREVRVDYANSHGADTFVHLGSVETRAIAKEAHADMTVPRTAFDPDDIEKGHDRAELRDDGEVLFAGIIEDVVRNDDTKVIKVEGWERLAERAEPTGGVEEWASSDAAIVRDAIANVDELEEGEIEATNPSAKLVFSHASQAYKIRQAEDVSAGFAFYHADKRVSYGGVGSNKSHYTLSPRRRNVSPNYEINEKAGYESVTHLRMLGAGEQEHQITAQAVASNWEPGDEKIWKIHTDKSIEDPETLQRKANRYVEELQTPLLEVTLTVKGARCGLGDIFRVYIPSENVDETLRVVEHRRHIDENGVRHEVTLSNHVESREDPDKKNKADVSNYNKAIEGAAMAIDGGGSRQVVGSDANTGEDINWETVYDYLPGVVHEHRVELKVEGQPYRAYSSGADAGGGLHSHKVELDITSTNNSDFQSAVVSISDMNDEAVTANWSTFSTISLPPGLGTSAIKAELPFGVTKSNTSIDFPNATMDFRLVATKPDDTVYYPREGGRPVRFSEPDRQRPTVGLRLPENLEDSTLELQARLSDNYEGDWTINGNVFWEGEGMHVHNIQQAVTSNEEVGEHSHGPRFGIMEQDADGKRFYPSNCDVIVNGESMGVSLGDGDGEFSETVDLKGKLREGDNRIEVTSDTLGNIQAFVQGEAVRRILGRRS